MKSMSACLASERDSIPRVAVGTYSEQFCARRAVPRHSQRSLFLAFLVKQAQDRSAAKKAEEQKEADTKKRKLEAVWYSPNIRRALLPGTSASAEGSGSGSGRAAGVQGSRGQAAGMEPGTPTPTRRRSDASPLH